jgi:hypothetical protein
LHHTLVGFDHVAWHLFDVATFDAGRLQAKSSLDIPLYVFSAGRTIVDCFRLAHQEGTDIPYMALKRWLKQRGNTPARLLNVAASFPRTLARIRRALEILL